MRILLVISPSYLFSYVFSEKIKLKKTYYQISLRTKILFRYLRFILLNDFFFWFFFRLSSFVSNIIAFFQYVSFYRIDIYSLLYILMKYFKHFSNIFVLKFSLVIFIRCCIINWTYFHLCILVRTFVTWFRVLLKMYINLSSDHTYVRTYVHEHILSVFSYWFFSNF